jgi:uncharacterized membrane protein YccF (DUF307 family)
MGLAWWLVGLSAFMTIIGIPWGKACFVIGHFTFFPCGKEAISGKALHQRNDIGTGALAIVGNIIGFIFAGVFRAIDGRTGQQLWRSKLPADAMATPMT